MRSKLVVQTPANHVSCNWGISPSQVFLQNILCFTKQKKSTNRPIFLEFGMIRIYIHRKTCEYWTDHISNLLTSSGSLHLFNIQTCHIWMSFTVVGCKNQCIRSFLTSEFGWMSLIWMPLSVPPLSAIFAVPLLSSDMAEQETANRTETSEAKGHLFLNAHKTQAETSSGDVTMRDRLPRLPARLHSSSTRPSPSCRAAQSSVRLFISVPEPKPWTAASLFSKCFLSILLMLALWANI